MSDYEDAKEAIDRIFGDTNRKREDAIDDLMTLMGEIDIMIDLLESDL